MKTGIWKVSVLAAAVGIAAGALWGCWTETEAQPQPFTISSPDLSSGTFANTFILNAFGCTGGNVSPQLVWSGVPSGTKSLALQVYDPDAPSGSGFWHWAVYDIPPDATGLPRGAGNSAATLPAGAFGGNTDFLDTGATGVNGNYGGPCPPTGDPPHRYIFTLYALAVDKLEVAGGVPKTGTAGLYGFVLNKGLGSAMIAKTSFTALYGR
jgi:Raf kinase inhibitor-like YbhB/YbcL family protein